MQLGPYSVDCPVTCLHKILLDSNFSKRKFNTRENENLKIIDYFYLNKMQCIGKLNYDVTENQKIKLTEHFPYN